MIFKVNNPFPHPAAFSPSPDVRRQESVDFHSLVKKKMEEAIPLENAVLEYLKETVQSVISETAPIPKVHLVSPLGRTSFAASSPPPLLPTGGRREQVETAAQGKSFHPPSAERVFEMTVVEAGEKFGIAPALIRSIIRAESNGNPLAVSKAGALGLMQLMPETAAELGVRNPFDPAENIMAGARYLRFLCDRYRGNLRLALAAYNWGMGNLEKRPEAIPEETKRYIRIVEMDYLHQLKQGGKILSLAPPHNPGEEIT